MSPFTILRARSRPLSDSDIIPVLPARVVVRRCEKIDAFAVNHSVSVAVQASREAVRRRGEIGSIPRSILVGHRRPNRLSKGYTASKKLHCITLRRRQPFKNCWKLSTESVYILRARSRLALDSDINRDYRLGWYVRRCESGRRIACTRVMSVACRPSREAPATRFEIGSIPRSILVGHRRPNRRQRYYLRNMQMVC